MKFIKPTPVTDAILVSSTRAENDYSAWSSGTTYALGAYCISTSTHRIYKSAQAGNLNHAPTTDDGTWWVDVGPTNRWAMFDQTVGSVTTQATPLTVVLDPGRIDALALLDVAGGLVDVTMESTPGGSVVYDASFSMFDPSEPIVSWWAFFTVSMVQKTTLVVDDLPPYTGGRLTVSITAGVTAGCGTLVVGRAITVGETLAKPQIGIIDYSRKETDAYGVTSVVQRGYAKRIDLDVIVNAALVDYVASMLAEIRATPVVWVGDESRGYESLTAYGWVRDWGITIAYPTFSEARLQIEGLV